MIPTYNEQQSYKLLMCIVEIQIKLMSRNKTKMHIRKKFKYLRNTIQYKHTLQSRSQNFRWPRGDRIRWNNGKHFNLFF